MRHQTLIKMVESMDKTQRMKVLKYLHDDKVKLCEGSDGTRINLSAMSKRKYTKLVKFVRSLDVKVDDKFRIE
jgi:hypothetical protein